MSKPPTIIELARARYRDDDPDKEDAPPLRRRSLMLPAPAVPAWLLALVGLLALVALAYASGWRLPDPRPLIAAPPAVAPAATCPLLDPAPADRPMIARLRGCPGVVLADLGATSEWRAVAPGREAEAMQLQEVGP